MALGEGRRRQAEGRSRVVGQNPMTFYPKTLKLEYEVILTKSFKDNWLITNLLGLQAQPVAVKLPA